MKTDPFDFGGTGRPRIAYDLLAIIDLHPHLAVANVLPRSVDLDLL